MSAHMERYGGLVSVVTPAFNSVGTIRRAILSVAKQTVPVLEHIVVDDGSTDGTRDLLEQLAGSFPWLRVVKQPNQGAGAARNRGINMAAARYVAFLDSDDYWRPAKVERQVQFMESTGAVFSYGDYYEVDDGSGEVIHEVQAPGELRYEDLLASCPVGCLTAAYNQEVKGKVYMPDVRRGQDWALWLSLTRDGTRAHRYPGTQAVRYMSRRSLSANKLHKAVDAYRIYREQEGLSARRAFLQLGRHSLHVLRKNRSRRRSTDPGLRT